MQRPPKKLKKVHVSVTGGKLGNLGRFRNVDSPALELNLELHHQRLGALHRVRHVDDLRHRAVAVGGVEVKQKRPKT